MADATPYGYRVCPRDTLRRAPPPLCWGTRSLDWLTAKAFTERMTSVFLRALGCSRNDLVGVLSVGALMTTKSDIKNLFLTDEVFSYRWILLSVTKYPQYQLPGGSINRFLCSLFTVDCLN
jgi:hypothetical protein